MTAIVGSLLLALALAATGYTLYAAYAVRRFARAPLPPPAAPEPVTLLKPLHGAEPKLEENLTSFLAQDWRAPVQMVAGSNRADDPALRAAHALGADVRAGAPAIGANAKIGNVANLMRAARHDLLVLSDSDMAAPSNYLASVAAALARPGVGAVTCLYRGRGDAGFWSRLAAAGISYQFAPGVVMSFMLGIDSPCMGSTIALRRSTLDAIGGFPAFADTLADDHAIGSAVRRLGLRVEAAPRLVLAHGCAETSLAAVWRHELRWAATLRGVNLAGHAGSILTYPLPLALLAFPFLPLPALAAVAAAIAARALLARTVDVWAGARTASLAWLPVRDILSFAVFLASFFARSVDWRGAKLVMERHGRVRADTETAPL